MAIDTVADHMSLSGLTIQCIWGCNDVKSTPCSGTVWFQQLPASARFSTKNS
jgi:hypothetical protein